MQQNQNLEIIATLGKPVAFNSTQILPNKPGVYLHTRVFRPDGGAQKFVVNYVGTAYQSIRKRQTQHFKNATQNTVPIDLENDDFISELGELNIANFGKENLVLNHDNPEFEKLSRAGKLPIHIAEACRRWSAYRHEIVRRGGAEMIVPNYESHFRTYRDSVFVVPISVQCNQTPLRDRKQYCEGEVQKAKKVIDYVESTLHRTMIESTHWRKFQFFVTQPVRTKLYEDTVVHLENPHRLDLLQITEDSIYFTADA